MGKSPGKWFKTILSGKKPSNSKLNSSKRREPSAAPGASAKNLADSNIEGRTASKSSHDPVVLQSSKHDEDSKTVRDSVSHEDLKGITQEQAATKAQAAFRGYLARRAFRTLKGIIRLQAVIRGHLVRRQAVATLFCIIGIVKVQALVRGQKIRCSNIGIKVHKNQGLEDLVGKHPFSFRLTASTQSQQLNKAFIRKLLASTPTGMPVRVQYGQSELNSSLAWLERWTKSCFWKPLAQSIGVHNLKSQAAVGSSQTVQSEQGRSNCHVKGVAIMKVENCTTLSSDSEKTKHSQLKNSSNSAVSVQGNPLNEVGKDKHNLRKSYNKPMETFDRVEATTEKTKHALKKASSSTCPDALEHIVTDSSEKVEKGASIPRQADLETSLKSSAADAPVDKLQLHAGIDLQPKENISKNEDATGIDKDLNTKVNNSTVNENQKIRQRSSSLSTKLEHTENGSHIRPKVPSYMEPTESVKAKLRVQGSLRFVPDESETKSNTRRHSLPASINRKSSSSSPRVQRVALTSSKGGIKNDKSLLSPREGDKQIQPKWRKW